jgi:hypothetical protein
MADKSLVQFKLVLNAKKRKIKKLTTALQNAG